MCCRTCLHVTFDYPAQRHQSPAGKIGPCPNALGQAQSGIIFAMMAGVPIVPRMEGLEIVTSWFRGSSRREHENPSLRFGVLHDVMILQGGARTLGIKKFFIGESPTLNHKKLFCSRIKLEDLRLKLNRPNEDSNIWAR